MAEFESNAVLANRIAELQRENSKIQSERDALAATVEALREAYSELSQNGGTLYRFKEIFAATPQQHLRDVRAEAGRAGWLECEKWFYNTDTHPDDCTNAADQYAASVKAGEA